MPFELKTQSGTIRTLSETDALALLPFDDFPRVLLDKMKTTGEPRETGQGMLSYSMPHELLTGDRVRTQHGTGTVLGFEAFDTHGETLPTLAPTSNGYARAAVRLDPDHTWPAAGPYYDYAHNMVRLSGTPEREFYRLRNDRRYTVQLEYTGEATPQHVARFCGDWIGCAPDLEGAQKLAEQYEASRWSGTPENENA